MIKNTISQTFLLIILLGSFSIIGSSYVGLNGSHVWRQSDVYSQMLGFIGYKAIGPLENFFGNKVIYDIPIYQFIVAKASLLVSADPLVTSKYVNFFFWIILLWSGELIEKNFTSGRSVFFWITAATSPLLLHYFSTPLPDVMATSLSAAAVAILMYEKRIGALYVLAVLMLVVSTLIKSPVPFVFLVFYFMYLVVFYRTTAIGAFSLRNFFVFIVSLAAAVSTEFLRKKNGFAQDPVWYFGTFAQRLSGDFWAVAFSRFIQANAFPIIGYGLLMVLAAYLVLGRIQALKTLIPFVIAFFSGWLIFSKVYFWHDYYEIPVTIMLFLASSISLNNIIAHVQSKWITGIELKRYFKYLCVCFAPLLVLYGRKISNYQTESLFDSIRFALRNSNYVLWVVDDESNKDPSVGGLTRTEVKKIAKTRFEQDCERILMENEAILIYGRSSCLSKNKPKATTYIEDDGFQFFLNRNLYHQRLLQEVSTLRPLINSYYSLYRMEDNFIYVKKNCSLEDTIGRFFLRFYKDGDVKMQEFDFFDSGAIVDDVCIAVRYLEKDSSLLETGQSFNGIQLWRVTSSGDSATRFESTFLEDVAGVGECQGYWGRLNGVDSLPDRLTVNESILNAEGWLAASIDPPIVPEETYLTLADGRRVWFHKARVKARPDVSQYFQKPELVQTGFAASFDVSSLCGRYTLGLAYKLGGKKFICPKPSAVLDIHPAGCLHSEEKASSPN